MRLILFRHGPAGNAAKLALDNDSQRRLTEKGRKRTRAAALGLLALGIAPQRAITSPYARALESAQITMRALGLDVPLDIHDSLLPEADPAATLRYLRSLERSGDIQEAILFGHQPHLGALTATLLGITSSNAVRIRKAGVAIMSINRLKRPYGTCLELLLSADELVRLGH